MPQAKTCSRPCFASRFQEVQGLRVLGSRTREGMRLFPVGPQPVALGWAFSDVSASDMGVKGFGV